MNILVTGSKGFIGSNLIKRLKAEEIYKIIEFNRASSWKQLEDIIQKVDFIFHFAGEVRPNSSDTIFEQSNSALTRKLISLIESKDVRIPILMASSIHATNPKNAYGKTKRDAERSIEEYGRGNKVPIYIHRLPHIFGEGCKPNYNSVISTWIHNVIKGKDVVVFDRNISISYSYVQDIVADFLACLGKYQNDLSIINYVEPSVIYDTTLGDVIDYIHEFRVNKKIKIQKNEIHNFYYMLENHQSFRNPIRYQFDTS